MKTAARLAFAALAFACSGCSSFRSSCSDVTPFAAYVMPSGSAVVVGVHFGVRPTTGTTAGTTAAATGLPSILSSLVPSPTATPTPTPAK